MQLWQAIETAAGATVCFHDEVRKLFQKGRG